MKFVRSSILLAAMMLATSPIWARSAGAPPGKTGSPVDGGNTCSDCHGSLNSGGGNVEVKFPVTSYTAGATYRVSVVVTDAVASRWGFELGAWEAKSSNQTGTLAPSDGNTRVITSGTSNYITHTSAGTRSGAKSPVAFEFDWTAPAAGVGDVVFYVAANAANGNGRPDAGDNIYSAKLQVPEAVVAAGPPALRASDPALPAFGGDSVNGFASNGYLELYGEKLSNTTRMWSTADFTGSSAPKSIDGVSVKVNGKDAAIYYVSPGQININTPDDSSTGPVSIEVTNNGKTGNSISMLKSAVAPALLTTNAFKVGQTRYVVALLPNSTANGPFVGAAGLISGVSFQTVKPGDRIILYALGCGPTNPATAAGTTVAANSPVTSAYKLEIGGVEATVEFFGAVAGSVGLYQINAIVPNVSPGEQKIELRVAGVQNSQNLFLSGITN